MKLGDRLRDARKRAGYTQKQLAERIGAKHNSVSNWENGLNMPDPATIETICVVLDVTPNDLINSKNLDAALTSRGDITQSEIGLLKKYRVIDQKSRGAIDALLEYYFAAATAKRVDLPIRSGFTPELAMSHGKKPDFELMAGKISVQSVAAGTGTYLGEDSFERILVRKNELTKRAAFYVPVSGDSMEPKYHNGDILIVEDVPAKYGEIGVFTLDGNGFVKERGKFELISLNPDYAPIPMNDETVCNGRVIGVLEPEWIAID